jgi:hypothetical protein
MPPSIGSLIVIFVTIGVDVEVGVNVLVGLGNGVDVVVGRGVEVEGISLGRQDANKKLNAKIVTRIRF